MSIGKSGLQILAALWKGAAAPGADYSGLKKTHGAVLAEHVLAHTRDNVVIAGHHRVLEGFAGSGPHLSLPIVAASAHALLDHVALTASDLALVIEALDLTENQLAKVLRYVTERRDKGYDRNESIRTFDELVKGLVKEGDGGLLGLVAGLIKSLNSERKENIDGMIDKMGL